MIDGNKGRLNDIGDETEAYNRQQMLTRGARFFDNPAVEQFNDSKPREQGLRMIPQAYQDLTTGPVDINSRKGRDLRQETISAGQARKRIQEVYNGWKQDYLKGEQQK